MRKPKAKRPRPQLNLSPPETFVDMFRRYCELMDVPLVAALEEAAFGLVYMHTAYTVRRGILTEDEYNAIMRQYAGAGREGMYAAHAEVLKLIVQRCPEYQQLLLAESMQACGDPARNPWVRPGMREAARRSVGLPESKEPETRARAVSLQDGVMVAFDTVTYQE